MRLRTLAPWTAHCVLVASVCSAMQTAATCALCWAIDGYVRTHDQSYTVPLVVYGTIWGLVTVFVAGVAWTGAQQLAADLRSTPRPPSKPPEQPQPSDTPRPAPAPIQPRPPKPPRKIDVTLFDLAPVQDATQEISIIADVRPAPRLPRHVPPEQLLSGDWRPRVAPDSKGDKQ